MTVLLLDAAGTVLELELPRPLAVILDYGGRTYRLSGELSYPPVYRHVA